MKSKEKLWQQQWRMFVAVAYPVTRAVAKLKLAEPEPESDSDEILSPDTGYFTENFNAINTTSSAIGIAFGATIVWLLLRLNRKKISKLKA